MKSSIFLLIIVYCLCNQTLSAQSVDAPKHTIEGTVSIDGQALPDMVVQIIKSSDSVLVKTEFTNEKGEFVFKEIANGKYVIIINSLGYTKYESEIIELNSSVKLPVINLVKTNMALKEVTVTARKSFIERSYGKVILNVENSIASSGSSAFEVIEKAPGVGIDNADNISLKGRSGIIVQIDGKATPMTGTDLANYLKSIPSSSIDKIEFISNPSAKYDAAGSAIINIKLKKDKRFGTNGTLSIAAGHGVYMKSNNSISLNHRNKKLNVFGNYSYAYREAFNDLRLERNFYDGDKFIGAYNQKNYLFFPMSNHIARAGADYDMNDKNSIGIVVNGVSNKFNPKGDNTSFVYNEDNEKASKFTTANRSKDFWYNYSANINYKHSFDTTGTELTADIDYAAFGNKTTQNFTTNYFDLSDNAIRNPYLLYGDLQGHLDIYSLKSDFVKPFNHELKFETGLKTSYVKADNDLKFFDHSNEYYIFDSTKSNHFIYKENINAAYVNLSKELGKLNAQVGLRVEHTHVNGKQLVYNTSFDTNYVQLFPNCFFSYKISENHSLEINYNRRINRPSYEQLNPFKFYLDPTTYKAGNPYLKPQTTHSIELSHVYKQKIYTTLGFGHTINNITELIAPSDNEPKITVQTNKNLAVVDVYSLNISAPIEITKWWYTQLDLSSYFAYYSGNIANTELKNAGNFTFNVNDVNTFNITKTWSAELSGNYRAPEIYAYEVARPIWYINIGIQKKFWDNKASIKLAFNDIFRSNIGRATTTFNGYKETYWVRRDTRVVFFNFTYRFGKNTVPAAAKKDGGAEDIKKRAGG